MPFASTGGGVYSITLHYSGHAYWEQAETHDCFCCKRAVDREADLFVVASDTYLHRLCLGVFLATLEGRRLLEDGLPFVIMDAAVVIARPVALTG
jgi:hypothetical protein